MRNKNEKQNKIIGITFFLFTLAGSFSFQNNAMVLPKAVVYKTS